jgi:hypothetical protein
LEEELLETDYEGSLVSELTTLETEAASTIPKGRCTPVGRRVGKFTCGSAEIAKIRALLGLPAVTVPTLRAAVEAAAGRAVSLAARGANALDRSRRSNKTRRIFCEAFGVTPEFVPPWRASLRGVVRWRDLGELVAIRLRDVAKILDGGCVHYFSWGSAAHCPECIDSPTSYFACSSFRGKYIICLGALFWRAWRSGDKATTGSTLLHEALHIYFGTTVSDGGRSGNANCYERFAVRLQNLFLHPATAANCTAGSCRPATSTPSYEGELEDESLFGSYPASVLRALNSGLESTGVRIAVAKGQRDENALTNLVFFARHPERQGRKLQRSERAFAQLSNEWINIRNRLVRPVLAAAGASPARPAPTGRAWVRELVPLLDRYRGDIPLDFLIGWIDVENGEKFNGKDKSPANERGYFQIHPDESKKMGVPDHTRLSFDRECSIKWGIELVRDKMKQVQQLGFRYGTDLFWAMVKLLHWLPVGVHAILKHMERNGFRTSNWEEFKGYVRRNQKELLILIPGAKPGTLRDPIRGIDNADRTIKRGRLLLAAAGI